MSKTNFEKRFLAIKNLIQEELFSNAKKELNNIKEEAKLHNLDETLKRANEILNLCEKLEKNMELKKKFSAIKNLIQEQLFSEAKKELNDIKEKAKLHNLDEILKRVNEILNLCEKLEKKKELKKIFPKIENLIQERKFPDAIVELKNIRNIAKRYNFDKIISWVQNNLDICNKHIIKKTVLKLGTKFARLQIAEISEECAVKDEQLIVDTVREMIDNKEIYAQYFSSTKSVAFDQQANIDEIDKLMATYKEWEEKKVEKK